MQVVKKLSFSDVGAGALSVCTINCNTSTKISASVNADILFNTSVITIKLIYTDLGSGITATQVNLIDTLYFSGYFYDFNINPAGGLAPNGIFTKLNGTLQIQIDTSSSMPTQGHCSVIVNVESLPIV